MDAYRAIKLIALRDVLKERTPESMWRKICRFYSKTFHTPLHLVETLPKLDVAQAYFEEAYDNMEEKDLQNELHELLEEGTTLEKSLAKSQDEASMDALEAEMKQQVKNQKKDLGKPIDPEKISKALLDSIENLDQSLQDLKEDPGPGFGLDGA